MCPLYPSLDTRIELLSWSAETQSRETQTITTIELYLIRGFALCASNLSLCCRSTRPLARHTANSRTAVHSRAEVTAAVTIIHIAETSRTPSQLITDRVKLVPSAVSRHLTRSRQGQTEARKWQNVDKGGHNHRLCRKCSCACCKKRNDRHSKVNTIITLNCPATKQHEKIT